MFFFPVQNSSLRRALLGTCPLQTLWMPRRSQSWMDVVTSCDDVWSFDVSNCLNVSLWRSLFRVQEKNYREVDEQLHQAQVLLEVPANRIMCTQLLALISDITKARDMTQVLPYSWFGQFRSVGPNRNLECAAFLAFLKDQTGREKEFLRTQASQAKEVRSRSGEWIFLSSLVCEAKLRSSMK